MPTSDWYGEYTQNQRLEELRDDLASASNETRRLRSQLARVQGSLEARVEQLVRAFDAFVELSDLRHELIVYAAAAERVGRLHHAAETAAGELTSYRDGQAERVRTADEDLDAIRARLTAG